MLLLWSLFYFFFWGGLNKSVNPVYNYTASFQLRDKSNILTCSLDEESSQLCVWCDQGRNTMQEMEEI